MLNLCIEVSDYNEPYLLCQPPSSLPDNPWFNDNKPRGIHTPLQYALGVLISLIGKLRTRLTPDFVPYILI
jgi:hypothetical protein